MAKVSRVILTSAIAACAISNAAAAASPYGTWLRPTTGGEVKVYQCGGGLGLRVTKSKDPKKRNKTLMCGAQKIGPNTYRGSIKNLDDGQTYTGKVEIRGNLMDLSGCVFGGIFCKTETWRRLR